MLVLKERFRDQDEVEAELRLLFNMNKGIIELTSEDEAAQQIASKVSGVLIMQAAAISWVVGVINDRPSKNHLKLLANMAKSANIPAHQVIDLVDMYDNMLEQVRKQRKNEESG